MYKLALSLCILAGMALSANAQDLVLGPDSAGVLAGRDDSLDAAFRSAIAGDGGADAEIAVSGKLFRLRLERGRIQALEIVPLAPGAQRLKSRADSQALAVLYRRLAGRLDQSRGESRLLLRFAAYLLDFFPENERFDGVEPGATAMAVPQAATPLCENRGNLTLGEYSPNLNPLDLQSEFAIVGDPLSNCLGRCGIACLQFEYGGQFQTPARAYTQGCFDHDLCARFTGDVLGNCWDEFLVASDDYLLGPDCAADIAGRWQVIAYRNENETEVTIRAMVIFFADGTLSVVGGGSGTWTQTPDYIQFAVGGMSFLAYGSATDLVLEGRMDAGGNAVGYWTAMHLTTSTETP